MDRQRCRVVIDIRGHEFGLSLGPGAVVDLDAVLGCARDGREVRVRDAVDPGWFEPLEPEVDPFIPPADEPEVE